MLCRSIHAPLVALTLLVALAAPCAAADSVLIVLNKADATASLLEPGTGKTLATLPTGKGPHEIDVAPNGVLAVVTDYGVADAPGKTLTVIDVPGRRVVRTIDLGEYRRPHGVAWLRDGRHALVTAEENKALLKVDVGAGKVVTSVATGQEISHMVVATPDGARAFVANIRSGTVSVIDLEKGELIRSIPTGAGAEGIAMTPDGKNVWITNREADTVTVLDSRSLAVVGEIKSASFPIRVKITPDGRHALVSNAKSGEVAVFDVVTRQELRRIPMKLEATQTEGRLFGAGFGDSPVPIGILIRPDGKVAWVANANADRIIVLDLEAWKVAGTVTAGREPDGLGWSGSGAP